MATTYPTVRMRRLRRSEQLRNLVRENQLSPNDLIYPIFIDEGINEPLPIEAMPGVMRWPEAELAATLKNAWDNGVQAVMLFGVSHNKDAVGSDSFKSGGLLERMIDRAKQAVPEMVVISDTCFCEYTDHGHCGVIDGNDVANDATLENLVRQALIAAAAGADVIAPSGMMDGTITTLRTGLDEAGFESIPIMAYSSKFASGFYGPFREAAGCDLEGDRRTYQLDPANRREAIVESIIDEAEGADILMVKPGMPYLDIVSEVRRATGTPLAVYQVSGEYAMIRFASAAGALEEADVIDESLLAFKRAGADLIITYFALEYLMRHS